MGGESPRQVIAELIQEGGLAEGAQYLIGVLGALAAMQQVWALALLALPTALVYLAFKRAKEMHDGTRDLLESMADTVDLRDPYTGGHSRRVTDLTIGLLRELRKAGPEVDLIVAAARVHDIGKIGIPDSVLVKPGALTAEERAVIETHAERGADLLQRYPDFARGVEIVRHHHERWDGGGYPHRLKGTEIPFGARVIAVADSFDAMTSDRPYRRALGIDRAAALLREGRGRQWDPVLVDAFLRSVADRLEQPAAPLLMVVRSSSDEHDPAVSA
jgi:HD-GYP domain-containing protein (c-di-GMP phosphodiesterase class II)